MRLLVEELCSDRCAGRAPGTPGGRLARQLVMGAMREAGLDPREQPVPACGGANVIAALPGEIDRWILVGAHHDHLGTQGGHIYRGADDNAAAVAILVEVGRALAARRADGRGVLLVAFDGEEPPHFYTEGMGSEYLARHPPVPLDRVDLMIAMDLVGHALGPDGLPDEVRQTVFALGAERSAGTGAHVDRLASAVEGVTVRRADAEIIPPLSDHGPFWQRGIPFLFLTSGRNRYYHTPQDTPDQLDYPKMAATARWLERFVRESCQRDGAFRFQGEAADDASSLRSLAALTTALQAVSPLAGAGRAMAEELLTRCDATGRLPAERRPEVSRLVEMLEEGLA